jgi:hypothetical protein
MYVCRYVYMYVYMYVCMYVCMHVCMYVWMLLNAIYYNEELVSFNLMNLFWTINKDSDP